MHHREARIIFCGCNRRPGLHIQIYLRPTQPEDAANHAHQSILHVRQLRCLLRTLPVHNNERMVHRSQRSEAIVSAENRVEEALVRSSRSCPKQRIRNRTVRVIHNPDRSSARRRLDIQRHRDRAVGIDGHIRPADVLAKRPAIRCHQSRGWNRRPHAECPGHKTIRGRIRQNRTQISLIRVISNDAPGPHHRLPRFRGVEKTPPGHVLRSARTRGLHRAQHHRTRHGEPEEEQPSSKCHSIFHGHLSWSLLLTGVPHRQGEVAKRYSRLPTKDGIPLKSRNLFPRQRDSPPCVHFKSPQRSAHATAEPQPAARIQEDRHAFANAITLPARPQPDPLRDRQILARRRAPDRALDVERDSDSFHRFPRCRWSPLNSRHSRREDHPRSTRHFGERQVGSLMQSRKEGSPHRTIAGRGKRTGFRLRDEPS